jgi:NADP-dependent 3-hydroxy acid dehydrogenase YdfG
MAALTGRVVVITGASSGIGRATAIALAGEGARVVAVARRTDRLEQLAATIRSNGGEALPLEADVTQEADMARVVATTVERFGKIDVMICNAGIGYHGPVDETSPEHMRRVVDVNVMGTLYPARAALIAMKKQDHGHIIAVSSIVGRRGVGGSSVYGATKAAQVGFIESLRAEFVGTPFHASVILPVSTVTEFREAIERDFGHTVSGHGPKQSAEVVAQAIVQCVISPKPEVYPFWWAKWLGVASVIAPGLVDRFVRRFGRRRVPPSPAHDGDHPN